MPAISSFSEITDLSDAQIQVLLGKVEIWDLIAAVRDEEAKAVKDRLFSVMAPKVQAFAQEELDVNKEADPEKIREAQLRMVSLASHLS
jgi:flagellar motor switch protein FliG